ncbi:hypothetical protein OH77DRAFT_1038974 [Trametes cingulata]|nr:hypothetical protein OH77DRAFT_1038974 [Trametes cingulata]
MSRVSRSFRGLRPTQRTRRVSRSFTSTQTEVSRRTRRSYRISTTEKFGTRQAPSRSLLPRASSVVERLPFNHQHHCPTFLAGPTIALSPVALSKPRTSNQPSSLAQSDPAWLVAPVAKVHDI